MISAQGMVPLARTAGATQAPWVADPRRVIHGDKHIQCLAERHLGTDDFYLSICRDELIHHV